MGEKEKLLNEISEILGEVESTEVIEYFLYFIKEKLKVGN